MKHRFMLGFMCGALLFGAAGVFAGQYVATENPFPVQLNEKNIGLEGYNINDNTYFKLRDIADVIGGFSVGFENDTIQLYTAETTAIDVAREKVAATADTETAELISEDVDYWYFAPCSYDMLGFMRDSGGHVSPATMIYSVEKATGNTNREQ